MAVSPRILIEVVLVIVFSPEEILKLAALYGHRRVQSFGHLRKYLVDNFLIRLVGIVDPRAIREQVLQSASLPLEPPLMKNMAWQK